jgi:hypothetical protein
VHRILRAATEGCAAVAVVLTLSACSGEPGTGDIKSAIRNNPRIMMGLAMMSQASAGLSGQAAQSPDAMLDRATIEKGSCVAASGASGVVCDFRIGQDGRFGPWGKARFYQANGGWQVEQ